MTPQEKLDDAKNQLHLLVTGQQARVYVDQNGERVEYTPGNVGRLRAYIAELEREINSSTSGPMQVLM